VIGVLAEDQPQVPSAVDQQPVQALAPGKVPVRVTCNALAMLAANRYVSRPGPFSSYNVIWQAGA
jgi:hypothetical protein